jgi:hypothetical protein
MDRRGFFRRTGGALLVLPFGSFLVQACYGYGSGGGGNAASDVPAAAPSISGSNVVYTSNVDGDHSHMYAIAASSFTAPTDLAGQTSVAEAHSHSIAITADDLQNVEAGQSIVVMTGTSEDHTHVFTFIKVE